MQAVKSATKETAGTIGVLFVIFWLFTMAFIMMGNAFKVEIVPPLVLSYLIWWTIVSLALCFIVSIVWLNSKNRSEAKKLTHE